MDWIGHWAVVVARAWMVGGEGTGHEGRRQRQVGQTLADVSDKVAESQIEEVEHVLGPETDEC